MEPKIAVELVDVFVRTRGTLRLADVSLCIGKEKEKARGDDGDKGEVFAFLGEAGSGASSVVQLLLGLVRPVSGTVRVFGRAPEPPSAFGGRSTPPIGVLFEAPALLRELTVRDNLALVLAGFRQPTEKECVGIELALSHAGAEALSDLYPDDLDPGETRRADLARILVREPPLLLCDTPLREIHPSARRELAARLVRQVRRMKATLVVATNTLEPWDDLADRVGLFEGGRLGFVGSPRDLPERARERFASPSGTPRV